MSSTWCTALEPLSWSTVLPGLMQALPPYPLIEVQENILERGSISELTVADTREHLAEGAELLVDRVLGLHVGVKPGYQGCSADSIFYTGSS